MYAMQGRGFASNARMDYQVFWVSSFQVGFLVAVFVVPYVGLSGTTIGSFSLLLYVHAGLWFLIMVADRFWRFQHFTSRTNGYLEFYRSTRHLRRAPILVYSGGICSGPPHCKITTQPERYGLKLEVILKGKDVYLLVLKWRYFLNGGVLYRRDHCSENETYQY